LIGDYRNPPVLIFSFSDESPFIAKLESPEVWAVRPICPEPATWLFLALAFEYENISSQLLIQMLAEPEYYPIHSLPLVYIL